MTATKQAWTIKVVKSQRGGQGQWFRYPAAVTTTSEADAIAYAEQFAAEQQGVPGTRILVLARKGDRLIREFRCG
jgi:hypothetical protein